MTSNNDDFMAALVADAKDWQERQERHAERAKVEAAIDNANEETTKQKPRRWNAKEREQARNERVNVAISREMYVKPQRKVSAKGIGKARQDGADQHGDVVVWSKAKIAEVYGV